MTVIQELFFGSNPQWVGAATWSASHSLLFVLNSGGSYPGLTAWAVNLGCSLTKVWTAAIPYVPSIFQFVQASVSGDLVWVGSVNANGASIFYAVNAITGALAYTSPALDTSTFAYTSPVVANGRVYVSAFQGTESTAPAINTIFTVFGL